MKNMTDWKEVHSTGAQPSEIDTTSSSTTVYERRNIRQEERSVGTGDTAVTVTEWVCEQREYTQEEYAQMHSPATQAIMQAISDMELNITSIVIDGAV